MEFVQPIKNIDEIFRIKKLLYEQSERDHLFFVFGINTGLRINDLLQVRVEEVWDGENITEFYIPANKYHSFYINEMVGNALRDYLAQSKLSGRDFLFKSKKNDQPITRQQAYRIINKAAQEAGIQGKIGTHTLRKTFGYHAYRKGISLSILQKIFHHSSPSATLHYIGIDRNAEGPIKVDVNL